MSTSHSRSRTFTVALLLSALGLVAACVPEQPTTPFYGIRFNAPAVGYVGKTYTPTATATSGLPVTFTLDATSTGCSLVDGVVFYESPGSCVINADQAGDETYAPAKQVRRTIKVYNCPPLRSGIWTGPLSLSANVEVDPSGTFFTGTVDLSSLGYGVQLFAGSIACEVVQMTFNGVPLTGKLSPNGSTLSSSYNGIDIVLNAPPA